MVMDFIILMETNMIRDDHPGFSLFILCPGPVVKKAGKKNKNVMF
jgi:hypothetical protein